MKKYITPEIEVSKFIMQDVVTASGVTEQASLNVDGGVATPFGGATGYSANDLKWANGSSAY